MTPDVLATLTVGRAATDVWHSIREAGYMFWDTLWALVLGFGVSGAVQAFVSRDAMRRRLGDHGPASTARASLYGMVSSSCSYAASAMARSLFAGGADFVASMVFMFASTNLVFELGVVLLVLIGWQFLVAEFVGGVIMIALLVVIGGLWFRGRALAEARSTAGGDDRGHQHGGGEEPAIPARERMRTRAGWSDAAAYTMSDLQMLRKEMVIGFLIAGFVTILVPTGFWNAVFLHGHGFWTSLENVVVGPLVALLSFVCSVGNVPLAAALWKGGITFGGVVSFVFADLITLPLLLIYRKQYGGRMALRMLVVFWAIMAAAGLATEYLFKAVGGVPSAPSRAIASDGIRLNYTTWLDIVALLAFAGMYWLYRNRNRLGGGAGYAKDPVCGMQVQTANAPASCEHQGGRIHFCSEHCLHRFEKDPDRYVGADGGTDAPDGDGPVDPTCGMVVDPEEAAATRVSDGRTLYFCGEGCAAAWDEQVEGSVPHH